MVINKTMINKTVWKGLFSSLAVVTLTAGIPQASLAQQPSRLSYQTAVAQPTGAVSHGYSDYLLGPGDQLALSVMGSPEFDNTYVVLPDGNMVLPLIGPMSAAGKTVTQLNQELTYRLQYYLIDPIVSSQISVLRPVTVNMTGAVHRPGPVQLTGITSTNVAQDRDLGQNFTEGLPTLNAALMEAGGVTRDADIREVTIRRQVVNGQYQNITVNLWDVIQAQGNDSSFVLRDGDTVFVAQLQGDDLDRRLIATSTFAPDQIRVRVVGEVVSPGEIMVSPDSSVSGAVAAAGGPTTDAQLGNVALVRMDDSGEIMQQPIDLTNLIDNNQIQDGDVVMVGKKGHLTFFDTLGRILSPLNILNIFGF